MKEMSLCVTLKKKEFCTSMYCERDKQITFTQCYVKEINSGTDALVGTGYNTSIVYFPQNC